LLPAVAGSLPLATGLPPLLPVRAGRPRVVALVGDSMMAVGLSAMLLRETSHSHGLQLLKAFRSGTGLSRPDVFDWMREYPAMLSSAHPDLVIVAIGANDAQGYVDANGKTLAFGTDPWISSYEARVKAFMDMLETSARQIVWVGLPPMRSASFDSRMVVVNRITYSVVRTYPNAAWWNPAPLIGDDAGQFRDFGAILLPNGHKRIAELRQPDGIHLSDDGASLLTGALIPWLQTARGK
jgi:hypothetical protein